MLFRSCDTVYNVTQPNDVIDLLVLFLFVLVFTVYMFVCLMCYRGPRGRLAIWLNVFYPL